MGRASASIQNRELAKQFAQLVTVPTTCVNDMIARSGPLSIFAALSECCPECVRGCGVNQKYGIAEAEFNKAVQACGFIRERDRRVNAMTRSSDPLGAGMYLFSQRRWRDVNDPQDKAELESGWAALCERLPWISRQCTLDRFFELVSKFHDGWQPNAGRARKKPRFDSSSPSSTSPTLLRGSTESSMDAVASLACSSPPLFNPHFNSLYLASQFPAHMNSLPFDSQRSSHPATDDSNANLMSTVLKLLQQQKEQAAQMQLASLSAALQSAQQKPVFPPMNLGAQNPFASMMPPVSLPNINVSLPNTMCNMQSLAPHMDILGLGKRDRTCIQFS
eukprot:CAMPEP_0177693712 /NCGR_PEP_ID=MMETSP0484_2-20121128/2546_1 /TAXON_ID=354590 /ORGANISM="Rhodomonas lens, Strain RHODO" /LENGTH=333 /DNA_ID=CAMNT_0019204541 /DNA_START=41 /DNA_END=1039 /DNA_ORIENTATION=+